MSNTKSFLLRDSKIKYIHTYFDKKGELIKPLQELLINFSDKERKYFAGMADGDGCFRKKNKNKTIAFVLELKEDASEPISALAEIFDGTVRKKFNFKNKNTKPSLILELFGIKAFLFSLCVYPYLLEKKNLVKEIILNSKINKKINFDFNKKINEKNFSFEYLAGYTDAEGSIQMSLRHQKGWKGKITSGYKFRYALTSNDHEHLSFIKNNLLKMGYNFRKDYIENYKNRKDSLIRKPTKYIYLKGGPEEHLKLYEKILPFCKIQNKIKKMKDTLNYVMVNFPVTKRIIDTIREME